MHNYFYANNGTRKGPVTIDGLKKANISKDTLIWRDGMDDWLQASELDELSEIFYPVQESEIVPEITKESVQSSWVETNSIPSTIDNTKMFKNSFFFKGRARRLEFGLSYIISIVAICVPFVVLDSVGESDFLSAISVIIEIIGIWFFISESVRRSHDIGHNGFFILIPYYVLWLIFKDSEDGINKYGNNPKGNDFKRLY